MDNRESEGMAGEEQDIARLLQAVGPREAMPEEVKARWEAQFRDELKQVLDQRRGRRRTLMGVAASVVAVGLVTLLSWQTPVTIPLSAEVRSVNGGGELLASDNSSQILQAGQSLSLNDTVSTGGGAFAALAYQGYDLRLNSGSVIKIVPEGIALQSGEIYISDEGADPAVESITVVTRFGSIEDVGTQFTVSVDDEGVVSTVRRGAIVVTTGAETIRAEAGPDSAREISFDGAQHIQLSDKASSGPAWEWIYQGKPDFQLEGKTVAQFLEWSSRETGLRVEYTSYGAQIYAGNEVLHGDITGLSPDRAVEAVLASTHLKVQRQDEKVLQITLPSRAYTAPTRP